MGLLRFLGRMVLRIVALAFWGLAAMMLTQKPAAEHIRAIGGFLALVGLLAWLMARRNRGRARRPVASDDYPGDLHWRAGPATYTQTSFADEKGIKYRRGATKGDLSDLIDAWKNKRRH